MRPLRFTVVLSGVLTIALGGPSLYPCPPDKWLQKQDVWCTGVQIPHGLCSSCYLNPPAASGEFQNCHDIYNKNGACLAKMNEYVENNQCDGRRATVMQSINSGSAGWVDWASLDYFLYAVCEMCCDCIPMGASKDNSKGQWTTDRGNCPAHAYYDICNVLPSVKYFRNVGEPENGALEGAPSMCGELNNWFNSDQSQDWTTNPKTIISPALDTATKTLLNAIECSSPSVWDSCFDLEKKQNNLGNSGEFAGDPNTGQQETNTGGNTDIAETGTGGSDGQCNGQVKWTCLEGTHFGDKFCCQKPGCTCHPGPVKEAEEGCYKEGGYKKPGVGYDLHDCSGNVRWGCQDAVYEGENCEWTCKKWGCVCYPFEEKNSNSDALCQGPGQNTGEVPTAEEKKDERACFPDQARALTPRGPVEMARLRIGDVVLARPGHYSPVYMFSHSDGAASTTMLRVTLSNGKQVTLSPGHHILVGKDEIPAARLQIGNLLHTLNGTETVSDITFVTRTGLYNPHTVAGTIVVDGVVCSTYTIHLHHFTAHALLSPLRAFWRSGALAADDLSAFMQYGARDLTYSRISSILLRR